MMMWFFIQSFFTEPSSFHSFLVINSPLSYVFSFFVCNHGHALAFTTLIAHKFNSSVYAERFEKIVKKLDFQKIHLNQNLDNAAKIIFSDRKHLDNNPRTVTEKNIVDLLKSINS